MGLFFHRLDTFHELEIGGNKVPTDNDDEKNKGTDYTDTEEAPGELQSANPVEDNEADDVDNEPEDQSTDDNEGDTPNEADKPDEEGDNDSEGDNEGTTDYTEEDSDGGDEGNDEGGSDDEPELKDDSDSDDSDTDDSDDSDDVQSEDDIRNLEKELFATLSPEQMQIKHKELKGQFSDMYNTINSIIERINDIPKDAQYVQTIDFVSTKLSELKDMVTDYVVNVYETKSYTENAIVYNQFLATLSGVNKILEKIMYKDAK